MPAATPAAIRSASIWVLPDPAPASTRMFASNSSWIRRRDSRSIARESLMGGEPPEGRESGVRRLSFSLQVRQAPACGDVVAVPAVVLIGGACELSGDNHFAQ